MDPTMRWWLENTAQGRRLQQRIMPESALGPRARAEAREEREESERDRKFRDGAVVVARRIRGGGRWRITRLSRNTARLVPIDEDMGRPVVMSLEKIDERFELAERRRR